MTDETTGASDAAEPAAPAEEPSPLNTTGPQLAALSGKLTDEAQTAANELIDALQRFSNAAFDAGEAGVQDVLHVFDIANAELTKLFSTARGIVDSKLG